MCALNLRGGAHTINEMNRKPRQPIPPTPRQKVTIARLRFDFTSILETRLLDPIYALELAMEEENLVKEVRREFHFQVAKMREDRKKIEPNIVQVAPEPN